ncbi:VanZ family protein [Cryptosporangium arvum]|uniref:VanZ family protein n=1 Tax=Cryptosporangium arvum TaxID=80871 RepID=UPI001B803936|nr:VanZ family protein [Cryptosporangium arvum]
MKRTWRVSFGIVVIISVFVLFLPNDDVPSGFPPGTDKVVHSALFAALALTGHRAGARARWLVAALVVYAVGSEIVQSVPALGRSSDPLDVVADCVGIVIGWLCSVNIRRTPR